MRFDTKIAIAVREDLATWQKLNVTAFLASAVAGGRPEVIGERYQDGSGHVYLPMFRQPVLVYAAGAQALRDAHGRALARELDTAVYIEEMFKTGHDADNRAAVRAVAADEMALWGWRCTARRTPWTRSSKASRCIPDGGRVTGRRPAPPTVPEWAGHPPPSRRPAGQPSRRPHVWLAARFSCHV